MKNTLKFAICICFIHSKPLLSVGVTFLKNSFNYKSEDPVENNGARENKNTQKMINV